jgi:lysophospholipase L1-like esterase
MVLTIILIAPLSVGYASAPSPAAITTIHYLALGDSIAAGTDNVSIQTALKSILARYPKITLVNYVPLMAEITLLQSKPETYLKGNSFRYTYQFRDYLKKKTSSAVSMADWAVSGYTSEQLLNQLKRLNAVNLAVLKHAEYITISIGGNDILPAGAESGFSRIDNTLLAKNVSAYKSNVVATLNLIKKYNPKATVVFMNFFNLYHPKEMSTDSQYLYRQVDDLLNGQGHPFHT